MPIELAELADRIDPKRTILVLGAGASVPSGAPSGTSLAANLWEKLTKKASQSEDLTETASILVRRYGRRAVIDVIVERLSPLRPTGGLLVLPAFGWKAVYTTNFDQLWESASSKAGVKHYTVRSNYDFTTRESANGTPLYKIHGCISQDESLGHKGSMILTEQDYEEFTKYRQTLFSSLKLSLLEGDALVIGQSLRDRHLHDLVKEILQAKKEDGASGQLYSLVYDADDLRAPLLEDRGAKIAFGGIDDFTHAVAAGPAGKIQQAPVMAASLLQLLLVSTVSDIEAERATPPNVARMFNGGAATPSDIEAGATFERLRYRELLDVLVDGYRPVVSLTGAGGVGKTTFARQLLTELSRRGHPTWEHKSDFSLSHREWIGVEGRLRAQKKTGFLLIDECTRYLRQVNQLVEHVCQLDQAALRIVLTANSAQWGPRLKSPDIYKKGTVLELSRLDNVEIHSLVNLLDSNSDIRALVTGEFKQLPRPRRFETLRQRCGADMYVCLKNIFANQSLDTILLQEYDALPEDSKEYYRFVAALQAVGTHVHRQLIIRMLGVQADQVASVLAGLRGIIDEYDIDNRAGIYGWTTRHLVIARKLTEYKFSGIEELSSLFERIIDNINPSVKIELQSIRDICDAEFGIGRLGDSAERQKLYRRLIQTAPGERIPWHRLIREILSYGNPEDADQVIRNAEAAVGADAPLDRFKVRLLLVRARKTTGISDSDRLALVRRAYEQAMTNTTKHRWDKFTFYTLCEVSLEAVRRGESDYLFSEAFDKLKVAAERILDPEMDRRARQFQDEFTHLR